MKTIFEHIEHIKGKPHHIRKRITFIAAASGAALVALVWLVGSISFGAFAIPANSFADSSGQSSVLTTDNINGDTGLAGAAAAIEDTSAPAHIEIVDTTSSTSGQKKADQTVIPF